MLWPSSEKYNRKREFNKGKPQVSEQNPKENFLGIARAFLETMVKGGRNLPPYFPGRAPDPESFRLPEDFKESHLKIVDRRRSSDLPTLHHV
jgi:hypothetical protein